MFVFDNVIGSGSKVRGVLLPNPHNLNLTNQQIATPVVYANTNTNINTFFEFKKFIFFNL